MPLFSVMLPCLGRAFPLRAMDNVARELSDKLPHLANVVDEIAIIRSMHTDQFNHAPGQIFFNTGFPQPGRRVSGFVAQLWARCGDG